MPSKFTLLFLGALALVVGYLFVSAGQAVSAYIPSWFPYVGSFAGSLGAIGFWIILIGLVLIIIGFILLITPRPQQRGMAITSA